MGRCLRWMLASKCACMVHARGAHVGGGSWTLWCTICGDGLILRARGPGTHLLMLHGDTPAHRSLPLFHPTCTSLPHDHTVPQALIWRIWAQGRCETSLNRCVRWHDGMCEMGGCLPALLVHVCWGSKCRCWGTVLGVVLQSATAATLFHQGGC